MSERHKKWTPVSPGTVIPAGQPYRIESSGYATEHWGPWKDSPEITVALTGHQVAWFIDSSWKPPLVLPTEPTWGIAVHRQFDKGWGFGLWHLDGDEFWQDHAHARFSWRPHNVLDFIPLTDEQVARIEQAR